MAVGQVVMAQLLEAVAQLREENDTLRHNFVSLAAAHEAAARDAAAAAEEAEVAAHDAAVRHAAAIAELHRDVVAARSDAVSRLKREALEPPGPGLREMGVALKAAHAACAALLEENATLRRENGTLVATAEQLHAEAQRLHRARARTRDAEVQHTPPPPPPPPPGPASPLERETARMVAQLRADVAEWRRAAEEATVRSAQDSGAARAVLQALREEVTASGGAAPRPRRAPAADNSRSPPVALLRLDDVPEADELSAFARHYARHGAL
jgi:hypothetical protein